MKRYVWAVALAALTVLVGAGVTGAAATDLPALDPAQFDATLMSSLAPPADDTSGTFQVKPQEFDPAKTYLVQSAWLDAIGCPANATVGIPNATFTGLAGTTTFTDSACALGDPKDQHNEGLLMAKTGPSGNFASAVAELNNVKGIHLTELGYDLRKLGSTASPTGSHCGAGAPRFNIVTSDGVLHFIGCNSPPPVQSASPTGWLRLRWSGALLGAAFPAISPTETVERIQIVFDEGQDVGPDQFGAAVLDNIDVNGVLVGHGATDASARP